MKTLIAILAVAAMAVSANAADLGKGSAVADLEERVAELEATAARKGNRKVTVTVYGQVSQALLWSDAKGNAAGESATGERQAIIDNPNSRTRLGFVGDGSLGSGLRAGYQLELGLNQDADGRVDIRYSAIYLDTQAGRVTLGKFSQATDGIGELTTANTTVASKLLGTNAVSLRNATFGVNVGIVDFAHSGGRSDVVRYDSPSLAGFIASVSWGTDRTKLGTDESDATVWDAALRYAGEAGGFRLLAGAGYREAKADLDETLKTWVGSASVMHVPTGIFVTGGAGQTKSAGDTLQNWHIQGGVERKWTPVGATTIYAEYGKGDAMASLLFLSGKVDQTFYGAGIVQGFEQAAFDLFAGIRRYEYEGTVGGIAGDAESTTVITGARLKF